MRKWTKPRGRGILVIAGAIAMLCAALAPNASADTVYGPLTITNLYNGRCLDADANRIGANGTPVQLWDCYGPGQTNQQWYLRQVGYDSRYQIVNAASGRCLDANAAWNGVNGTPVQLWDCYGTNQTNQIWWVYRQHDVPYTIQNVASNRVLDAAWQSIGGNGTPIQLWDDLGDGQRNQRWGGIS